MTIKESEKIRIKTSRKENNQRKQCKVMKTINGKDYEKRKTE